MHSPHGRILVPPQKYRLRDILFRHQSFAVGSAAQIGSGRCGFKVGFQKIPASGGWVPENSGAFWDGFKLGSKGLSQEFALGSDFGVPELFGTVSRSDTGWFGSRHTVMLGQEKCWNIPCSSGSRQGLPIVLFHWNMRGYPRLGYHDQGVFSLRIGHSASSVLGMKSHVKSGEGRNSRVAGEPPRAFP